MNIKYGFFSLGVLSGLIGFQQLVAAPSTVPIFLVSGVESQVMINMSNDHQLFYKAYDDWSDVDAVADGVPDTTYKHSIDYYGYFDSFKCYDYSSSRFVPQAITADKYCNAVSGSWSGNFLNWSTMTRMDTVRKTLFGGLRSTDTGSLTVLERAYLPGDAHSFAKYYQQASAGEIAKLTPWNVSEITLCNTTYAADGNSETRTNPPLIRVAQGNFALWAANERYQCHWDNHSELQSTIFDSPNPNTNNGNDSATTGLNADPNNPDWAADRLGSGDYIVRVEACVAGLIGQEKCKIYPSLNSKPIGLLQEYGEDGDIHFGLITGSYAQNKSGGTLRKNIGPIDDEIEETTNGTFTSPPPAAGNIISNLSVLRVTGYDHNPGIYNDTADNCDWGLNSFNDGRCTNWGNPQTEIYLESLRYFAGASPVFNANDATRIPSLSGRAALGTASSWIDPLDNTNYCAPVKIIHFNASVSSYDDDQLGGASSLLGLSGASDVNAWTDRVGAATGEGIAGNDFFIGEGTTSVASDGICTAKTLTNLSDAEGICPEAPRLEGGYDIAGLAYYAHTQSIRNDLSDPDGNTVDVKVETFGVTLAPAVPKLEIPVPGSTQNVVILPACRNESVGGNCAIVDFKIVLPHRDLGSNVFDGLVYVNWEDSEQGGDFDQDMAGSLYYLIDGNANTIQVWTRVYADSTPNRMGFGYIIGGTTQDGFHTHSGINDFTAYTDPTGVLSCNTLPSGIDCDTGEPWTSVVYTLGSSSGSLLKDPLYYAAKWGGFEEESDPAKRPLGTTAPNDIADQNYEWDSDGDGQPDNYFFARNPGQLNEKVGRVFQAIATVTSSASVVANSVSLQTTTRIYQARFDSADWSGKLLSFPVSIATGALLPPEWDAGVIMTGQNYDTGRHWITWNDNTGDGAAFRWADISAAQQAWLNLNPDTLAVDALGSDRLDYLRGDRSNELSGGSGNFRNRSSVLADVVHSTPTVVAAPGFGYRDKVPGTTTNFESVPYSQFKVELGDSECVTSGGTAITSWTAGTSGSAGGREPMLYFGSNGGPLHAVSACTGEERLAYVPNAMYPKLSKLTSIDYAHEYYVDGPSTVVDAFFGGAWHTVLVGTLRGGGKALFALDVTDPNNFSELSTDPAEVAMWEIEATPSVVGSDFEELGYTFSQPAVVKAEGLGWVAVFGNGYDSKSGHAVLYFVNIQTGALMHSIDFGGTNNGLSTVSPIDRDGDGDVDLIYAGDLNGNIWRVAATGPALPDTFDLGTGFGSATYSLLYTAKNDATPTADRQPITSRMAVGLHPYSAIGRMVYFGTGKYYEIVDQDPANAVQNNSMYGIWDRDDGTTVPSVTTRNSNTLQQQTIDTQTVGTFGSNSFEVRVLSSNPITWVSKDNLGNWNSCSATGSCGWYLDLTDTGEKMVATPILRGGRLIFVTTIPSLVPCEAGGTGWLMEIDPRTGGQIDMAVFDLNGDGVFDYNDDLESLDGGGNTVYENISGKKSKVGILQPPAVLSGVGGSGDGSYGGAEGKYSSGTKDAQIDVTIENPGMLSAGRKSWGRVK